MTILNVSIFLYIWTFTKKQLFLEFYEMLKSTCSYFYFVVGEGGVVYAETCACALHLIPPPVQNGSTTCKRIFL